MRTLLFLLLIFFAGCAGTGFDKKATLVPNSISITYGQEKYLGDPQAYKGFTVGATWEFKN